MRPEDRILLKADHEVGITLVIDFEGALKEIPIDELAEYRDYFKRQKQIALDDFEDADYVLNAIVLRSVLVNRLLNSVTEEISRRLA